MMEEKEERKGKESEEESERTKRSFAELIQALLIAKVAHSRSPRVPARQDFFTFRALESQSETS